MAKLHKMEIYILDSADEYNTLEQIISDVNDRMDISLIPFDAQSVSFDFHDSHVLNFEDARQSDYRGMFPSVDEIKE